MDPSDEEAAPPALQEEINRVFLEHFGRTPLKLRLEDIQGEFFKICSFDFPRNIAAAELAGSFLESFHSLVFGETHMKTAVRANQVDHFHGSLSLESLTLSLPALRLFPFRSTPLFYLQILFL